MRIRHNIIPMCDIYVCTCPVPSLDAGVPIPRLIGVMAPRLIEDLDVPGVPGDLGGDRRVDILGNAKLSIVNRITK